MSICELLVSPNHCEYMGGTNWVKDQPLRSGESVSREIPPGKYAIWVELCTEEYRADEGLRVAKDTVYSIRDDPGKPSLPDCGTSLTIINEGDVPICKMWISNHESAYVGRNWLGSKPIQPGESLTLALRPDRYTLRAEDCSGDWLRSEVDLQISADKLWTVP